MEKQPDTTKTIGQAIDELIRALGSLDEGSRMTAIRAASEHLKIPLFEATPVASQPAAGVVPPAPGGQPPSPQIVDIKSFRNKKQPSSANEMAGVVAFYLSELAPEGERKSDVQTEDMVKYFKEADFPLPKRSQMLLTNAKNAGYFDSGGTGLYKLNAVGYNLVAHSLPRAGGEASAPRKPRKLHGKGRGARTNKAKRA